MLLQLSGILSSRASSVLHLHPRIYEYFYVLVSLGLGLNLQFIALARTRVTDTLNTDSTAPNRLVLPHSPLWRQ